MISRRFLLSGIAALAMTTHANAGLFGFKTKAEREAEAIAEADELKALKRSLRQARKKGKKLSAADLARLDDLKKKEAQRLALAKGKSGVKKSKLVEEPEVKRVSRRELARIQAEDEAREVAEVKRKLSRKKPKVIEEEVEVARLETKKVVKKIGKKTYTIDAKFEPQEVAYSGFASGSIVIDSQEKFLYLIETPFSARRYGVAVGKEGLAFKGTVTVGDKQEWPRWIPTKEMIERDPEKYAQYAEGMDGGPNNPLGARAIYLYDGPKDTYLRIHGTTQPWTIGTAASNGCFRMVNEHVIDLFSRVPVGTKVTVI
jgi:lipoprotein-anchoring transpeptidase ErfK/SrfK